MERTAAQLPGKPEEIADAKAALMDSIGTLNWTRDGAAAISPAHRLPGFGGHECGSLKEIAMTSLRWIPGRAFAGHLLPAAGAERRARHTARVLRGLDDHLLADIGVRRDQIDAAAHAMIAMLPGR